MQAIRPGFTPPTGPLGALTTAAHERADAARPRRAALERAVAGRAAAPDFLRALQGTGVAVIAELKRRSPSKGVLNDALEAPARGAAYEQGGAAALSVLTEPTRFGGTLDDLDALSGAVRIPLLRKDFLVDEVQLLEARAHGASAVLLIARALPDHRLATLAAEARALGLEPLVEVRDRAELEAALAAEARVIGVNNRDLETLVIHPDTGPQLIPSIPPDRIAVYESGVLGREQVELAAAAGADAVLVGSVLSTALDGAAAVRALAGVARRTEPRGG